MELFLDTNVLLDHFGSRAPFASDVRKILAMGLFGDTRLWVPPQSFNDMFYILRRVVSPEEIQGAFAKAYEYIHVCSEDADDMARAAERSWPDMEDCLIALCAEKTHAKYLVTRDVKSFAGSAVEPITPKELVSRMEAERGISCEWLSEP